MARYRVLVTPYAGAPAFLVSERFNSANIYSPYDGAVLERPDCFQPYETISRTAAGTMARLVSNDYQRGNVLEWQA